MLSRIVFSFTTEDFFLFLNHFVHLDLKLQPINSPFLIDFQSLESVKVELDKTLKEVTILRKQSGAGEEKVRNILIIFIMNILSRLKLLCLFLISIISG